MTLSGLGTVVVALPVTINSSTCARGESLGTRPEISINPEHECFIQPWLVLDITNANAEREVFSVFLIVQQLNIEQMGYLP